MEYSKAGDDAKSDRNEKELMMDTGRWTIEARI